MNVRIVVVDERKANFFDASRPDAPLTARGSIENPTGGMKDIQLETDRPGRRFGGTLGVGHRSAPSQSHHHAVNGERSTERHELALFAKEVAHRIDAGRIRREFDKLVIVAPPRMLGLLRQSLPSQSQSMLACEISKDLMNRGPEAILNSVPREAFLRLG